MVTDNMNMNYIKYLLTAVLFLAIGVGISAYVIKMKPDLLGLSLNQAQSQAEADKLISEVALLIALPTDEKPTVVTVTDLEKVKNEPFFKNAKNGDIVLIYNNARKAILFRPSERRIIEVGALNINNQQADDTQGSSVPIATPTE